MRKLRLLGPAKVESIDSNEDQGKSDSDSIPRFRSRSAVALLGYLATERRAISREYLATLFWPDEEPGKGRGKLRRELYNLGKILPECWETDVQMVRFVPSADTSVDIYALQQLEEERNWQKAAEMLGGEFLEGVYLSNNLSFETWLLAERRHWQGVSQTVLSNARDLLTRRGMFADALRYGRRLTQVAPWDEESHRHLMRLLAWTGQREAAMRQFTLCEQILAEELSVEPSTETWELFRQIQEETLAVPSPPPAFLTHRKARYEDSSSSFVARERELAWLNQALNDALRGQGGLVFLTGGPGRGKTVLMDAFARQAMKSHPDLLAVKGNCEAGALDPYLPFRDMMAMLTGDVEARWLAGSISGDHARRLWMALPHVAQSLLEHGPHLLPILLNANTLLKRAAAAEPAGAPWLTRLRKQAHWFQEETAAADQSHLFEQFTNVLLAVAEKQPLLLLLDDLQWMNPASAGLLFHLGRRLNESVSRILIVCAYRPEEIIRDLRGGRVTLAKVLAEFRQSLGNAWLSLSWADVSEGQRFVDAVVDSEPNRFGNGFRSTLFRITRGHPLFTVELLKAMKNRGDLVKDGEGYWSEGPELDWGLLPTRIEAVIEERVGRLEPELRDLLTVASVEGENFTAEVVGRVQGLSQRQILGHLSQGLEKRHRLVREREDVRAGQKLLSRYQFTHILFQRYLYDGLSAGERRLLHREVGQALEALYGGQTAEKVSQLAHHFLVAGEREKGIEYSRMAAQQATAAYAYKEALEYLQQALEAFENDDLLQTRLELLEELADIHNRLSIDTQAIARYQEALELWSRIAGADKLIALRLHRKIVESALNLHWTVEFEALERWLQTVSASQAYLESRLPLVQSELQLEWVYVLTTLALANEMGFYSPINLEKAEGYARASANVAEQMDALEELSAALAVLAGVFFMRGQLSNQLDVSRRRMMLIQDPRFSDLFKQIATLGNYSSALMLVGEYAPALHHLLEGERLAIQTKSVGTQVWMMALQSLCLIRLDRWDEVLALEEKLRKLERHYSLEYIGGANCIIHALCGAARALRGDFEQAKILRERAYTLMIRDSGGSPENWRRTQYY